MQYSLFAVVAALAAFAVATPSPAGPNAKRDCSNSVTVFFPDTCPAGFVACNGAGSITLCCEGGC